jgi:ribonuclease III
MKLAPLEKMLGHSFRTQELLERAVMHRSWAHENAGGEGSTIRDADNETLEFVGDSVVGLVIAEALYERNPDVNEGGLSLMKHSLVRMESLAAAAGRLKLGDFVRLSSGEEKIGGRRNPAILADAFEAVVAAIFLDGGYPAARSFVTRVMNDEITSATPRSSLDVKTLLQETLQANKMTAPTYNLVRSEGQPHARTFYVEAVWESGRSEGMGRSIKAAEMMAANNALQVLSGKTTEN